MSSVVDLKKWYSPSLYIIHHGHLSRVRTEKRSPDELSKIANVASQEGLTVDGEARLLYGGSYFVFSTPLGAGWLWESGPLPPAMGHLWDTNILERFMLMYAK